MEYVNHLHHLDPPPQSYPLSPLSLLTSLSLSLSFFLSLSLHLSISFQASIKSRDIHGRQPLHHGVQTGAESVVMYLLEDLHVDVNEPCDMTPLHCAAQVIYSKD